MGRQSAGAGFVKGFIERGATDRLIAITESRQHFEDFRALAGMLDPAGRDVVQAHPLDRRTLRSVGSVFVPGPGLEREAWNRRFGSERDYSLCGVTHTIATDRVAVALGRVPDGADATVGRSRVHVGRGEGRGQAHPGPSRRLP